VSNEILLLTVPEAAKQFVLSRSKVYELLAAARSAASPSEGRGESRSSPARIHPRLQVDKE